MLESVLEEETSKRLEGKVIEHLEQGDIMARQPEGRIVIVRGNWDEIEKPEIGSWVIYDVFDEKRNYSLANLVTCKDGRMPVLAKRWIKAVIYFEPKQKAHEAVVVARSREDLAYAEAAIEKIYW